MTEVIEDYQVWKAYPQYRWIMDKLGVSLRLGYHAGPAGIPVERTGWYIVRPVYNPYGMGIGASKKWFDSEKTIRHYRSHAARQSPQCRTHRTRLSRCYL